MGVKPQRVEEWEKSGHITFSQADRLAKHTHTPLGFLYLSKPAKDNLTIPDLRTTGNRSLDRPSLELLDTVKMMKQRQAWMRETVIYYGQEPLTFVDSMVMTKTQQEVAAVMYKILGLTQDWAKREQSWSNAFRSLKNNIEKAGVLVFINGVVGNNTSRKLVPGEFRGFALNDEYVPLIFINGADFKAAQMFTLIHELAHILFGHNGLSNFNAIDPPIQVRLAIEKSCNNVAAEFLVPATKMHSVWKQSQQSDEPYQFLARHFKVSSIVAARRARDLKLISQDEYTDFLEIWKDDDRRLKNQKPSGGSFWATQHNRIGKRFAAAVLQAVHESRLLYRDAYSLTGLNGKSFDNLAKALDIKI